MFNARNKPIPRQRKSYIQNLQVKIEFKYDDDGRLLEISYTTIKDLDSMNITALFAKLILALTEPEDDNEKQLASE